jgi:hypothetical protein
MNLQLEINDDEWGWFVDLETNDTANKDSTIFENSKKYFKKLEVIHENHEEYDYCNINYEKNLYNYEIQNKFITDKKNLVCNKHLDVVSKSVVTAFLVYVIFFMF